MREFIEEVATKLLKGFKAIMDDAIDKLLKDFRNDLKVVQKRVPIGSNQKREESNESSFVTDSAEPNNQVSSTEVSNVVEFSDSPLEPLLVQGVVSTELVETKPEPLLTCSAEDYVFDELFMITSEESNGIEDSFGTLLDDGSANGLLELPQDKVMQNKVTDDRMELQEKKVQSGRFTSIEDQFNDSKLLLMEKKLLIRDKVSMGEGEIKPNRTVEGLICLMQKFKRIEDVIVDTLKLRVYIDSYLCETFKAGKNLYVGFTLAVYAWIIKHSNSWVTSSKCYFLIAYYFHSTYKSSCSQMYEANSKATEIQYGTRSIYGFFIEDYVVVGDLVVKIQEFIEATKELSLTFLLAKSDGILGLGFQEILVGNVVHVSAITDSGTSMLAGLTGIITQISHAIGESEVVRQELGANLIAWGVASAVESILAIETSSLYS
ncbi:hypothetical protein V6N12_046786 [Hibiscus sabdariffa]|uniref:Peptidase A1 domain-containing protein n=1 Tax=Hibiscus sabdariffa TaxID=183260 RepID=A0ABR2AWN9_9ROSI